MSWLKIGSCRLRWVWLAALAVGCSEDEERPDVSVASRLLREERFDSVAAVALEELGSNDGSGLSIAVMEAGAIVWAEGFGSASPVRDSAVGVETTFQIGSTTKQLTAMAVLAQVDRGLYSLDDTIAELLPGFSLALDPEWADQATLRHLLSHQSGLVDHVQFAGTTEDRGLSEFYRSEFATTQWAMNPPGLFWNYSNPNFDLAGFIAEEHDPLGRSYPEIISEDLFEPLGMSRSFARVSDAKAAGGFADSFGSHWSDFHLGLFPDVQLGEPRALSIDELPDVAAQRPSGGSTFSTPSDMCRWGDFVMHGEPSIIGDEARALLTAPAAPTQWGTSEQYGLGQFVWSAFPLSGDGFSATEYYPIEVWEHGGNTLSFASSLVIVPEHDVVISILSNGGSDAHAATQEAALRAVLEPLPAPLLDREHEIDGARIPALVGRYFDEDVAGDVLITEGGAHGLQISIPAFEARGYAVEPDLVPSSTYVWFVTVNGLTLDLTFILDGEGQLSPWLRTRFFAARRAERG